MHPTGLTPSAEGFCDGITTLGGWLSGASQRLAARGGAYPLPEAAHAVRLLACSVLNQSKSYLSAHPELGLDPENLMRLETALSHLMRGEALPYVLGEWEFYGRMFILSPHVLIPRPETELMIEQALSWVKDGGQAVRAADVGSGSGCIAVTLALELQNTQIAAIDISSEALRTARMNIQRCGAGQTVTLIRADLLSAAPPGALDLICANLPYIPSGRLEQLEVARREPLLALDGGADGLALIRRLLPQAARALKPGGLALLEIDDTHSEAVLNLAARFFPGSARVLDDLQGKPRLLRLEKVVY